MAVLRNDPRVSYYCSGWRCLRTTYRMIVKMRGRTYYYCVCCGRRLEQK